MTTIAVDADLFLDDFEVEARAHLERIEASFLDVDSLAGDPDKMNSVFRTAHSLKGTAGFFSLGKIVSIAHELESVFSQIKDGKLAISDEITDVVLQSVDCLRELVDNLRADETIDPNGIVETLKVYSSANAPQSSAAENTGEIAIPFDCKDPDTVRGLKNAARHGHKFYYINIGFNRGLGKYYVHPEGLFDSIQSIGDIAEVIINGNADDIIRGWDPSALTGRIIGALSEHDTSTLELLVTSVLEPELFAIAVEIDQKNVFLLSKESLFSEKRGEEAAGQDAAGKPVTGGTGAGNEETGSAETGVEETGGEKAGSPETGGAEAGSEGIGKPEAVQDRPGSDSPPKADMAQAQKPEQAHGSNFLLHLDISVINSLLDFANEMVLTRNQLLSATSGYEKTIIGLSPILHDISRLTSEIQDKVMLTRMQPISVVFSKFPRIIRDTAKALKKDIEIEILGGDVTLDKYLLDALNDPITQLVKNSADHGVESAERRAELGKPQKGKITLNAFMRDGSAIIEVADDGAGIDTDAVKERALERGIVSEDKLSSMAESDIFALILEPGFSTAKKVTNLSGRGVGMDIVKTNIEKLSGSIEIESVIDKGTTIRLRMPLTLSVVRSLIVEIDAVRYAVPEMNVERIVRLGRDKRSKRLEMVNGALVLILGESVIPVVTMDEISAKAKGAEPPTPEALQEKCMERDAIKCLVLRAGDRVYALLIDDAKDTEQTLVKPLPVFLKNCTCYFAVTVLGNGSATAILDVEGIMRLMGLKGAPSALLHEDREPKDDSAEKQYIIFTCSGAEFFALETAEISRIETISAGQIQQVGSGRFVNIAGESVRVVRPESYIPVASRRYAAEKLHLLTLKNSASPIGLLAGKVLDKVEAAFTYDEDRLRSDFIFGTSSFGEKILIFLDPAAIAEEVENDNLRRKKAKKAGAAV